MKKFYSIITIIMMVLTATLTTGCTDENEDVAYNLWGTWEGNMYMQSQYNGRVYQSSYSVLAFDKNPYQYASGTGYWIDYYSNAPWDYYSSRIQWRVTGNQEIQIYSQNEGRTYYIYNYSMGSYRFTGWIDDGQNDPVYFELRKTSEPDWGDYDWDGYYWDDYYYGYNYSPARSKSVVEAPVRGIIRNDDTNK